MSFKIISIDGNIGSGKSTLLAYLKEHFTENENIIFLKEPVDEWENIKDNEGKTILQNFYENQKKYSFSFQMLAYISRLNLIKEAIKKNPNAIIITERSLYTDKMVFAKMLYDDGLINSIDYQIYLKLFESFTDEYPVNKIIYVKTKPNICIERIKKRSRTGETNIQLDYLVNLDKYHNEMINSTVGYRSLSLDGDLDIYENSEIINYWIQIIKEFIYDNN
jgi:deoxycitidine kinase/deoxyguanosine kinase